jgi:alkylation response protein AidB-like acyl-CoA dehydrogenase
MNFDISDDQRAIIATARAFAQKEFAPFAAQWDADSHFPVDVIRRAGALGFCSLYCPAELGGMGLGRLDATLVFEELAAACTSTTAYITIHNMATWMASTFGSDTVKSEWVPALLSGEKLASYALTEPGAGSDAASLKTRAQRDGDDYCLNGSKAFISGAGATDALVLMARTGDDGARGITCFLVPADAKGIAYGRNEEKMGWKSQPTRLVSLTDVRIPARYRIGAEGDGFRIAMKGLDGGRLNIATCSVGTAQAALERAAAYLNERKQFGKALAEFQALQFRLADMATDLVAARQMVRMAAWKLDNGDAEATTYCAMAKRFATDAGFAICNEALQLHGGYGYIREYPLERHVRDTRVHQILEGSNEIMRLIIARRLLADAEAASRIR